MMQLRYWSHIAVVRSYQILYDSLIQVWHRRRVSEHQAELQKKFKHLKMEQITRYQGINLYIKNLEDDIDEERLKKEFSAFGQIRSAKIMDDKGVSKGFGFICFTTAEEAQHAINEMNSRILQGCTKPLYVALHEPKDIRRQKLAQRHAHRTKHLRPPNVPNVPVGPGSFVSAPPPTVYYQTPGPAGSAPFGYQQNPQPQLPRQAARGGWPGTPQHQAQQYPLQGANAQYVQARSRGGRSGQMGGRGGGRVSNRRNNQQGAPQELGLPHEITLAQLDQYPPEQQKLLLGERLYPMIQKSQPQLSGKITGMLLDSGWSIEELFSLLGDEEKLNQKIEEAVGVLKRAQQQQEADGTDEYQDQPGDDGEAH